MSESSVAARYPARAWRPAPLALVSLILHAGGLGVLVVDSAAWLWIFATLATNHLVLTAAVFFPRAQLLGPNINRLPLSAASRGEVALTFDDGPDLHVTPRVLELLDRYGAKASFFCVGEKAARYPDLVRQIALRGHSIENHSYGHSPVFACFGLARMGREIERAQHTLGSITGKSPQFFRAPVGFRSPLLDFILVRYGLRYVSWTRRGFDSVTPNPQKVLARLIARLNGGDVLLLHDSNPCVLDVLPPLLEELGRRNLRSVALTSVL